MKTTGKQLLRIAHAVKAGHSARDIAEKFKISRQMVYNVRLALEIMELMKAGTSKEPRFRMTKAILDDLRSHIECMPMLTMAEIQNYLKDVHNLQFSAKQIKQSLDKAGIRRGWIV